MAPGWDPGDIDGGDIAPIESVMLDAGRIQPATDQSARSRTPALDAGRALAGALGVDPTTVTIGTAPAAARELAAVRSAPLIERLGEMMNASDNVMAECIGREVAAAMHRPLSFAGAVDAVTNRLALAHIGTGHATLMDSSGLSVDDRVTAQTLGDVMQAAAGPDQPALRPLLDVLPIAGGSGTLSNRFLDPHGNGQAAGWLRAKTGSLTAVNSLAGLITDHSGRVLTFAFISNDAGPTGRTAIDSLAATLWSCGCVT
jgi:D-alanyl-D-alanine carboxypeptidase/D-alanyl-D-alanine-endopeptidase (penicillin-binding protein 4)